MFIVDKILSDADIEELQKIYSECQSKFAHQDYNLFDVERRDVPSKLYNSSTAFKKLTEYSKQKVLSFYFLKYTEGSFARFHEDNGSDLTIVTYISKSDDLVGGIPVNLLEYERKPRPSSHYAKRNKSDEKGVYGTKIIPEVIVDVEEGDSIVYGPELKHGVSKVQRGERIVLISWFSNAGVDPTRKR